MTILQAHIPKDHDNGHTLMLRGEKKQQVECGSVDLGWRLEDSK